MRQKLEERIVKRWPMWFDVHGDLSHTLMPNGFLHGDGWFDILCQLCQKLEPLVAELEMETGRRFEVLQIKEKFGSLRFYVNHSTDAMREWIAAAELESCRICEVCGRPGRLRQSRWLQTRCDVHASDQ